MSSSHLTASSRLSGSVHPSVSCLQSEQRWQPRLAFLPLDSIQLHEEYAPSREEALGSRLQHDGYLANPLIVAELGEHFVALDGHHRRECLRKAGCSHALVQQVPLWDQQQLRFDSWLHLAQVESPDEMIAELFSYGIELQPTAPARAERELTERQIGCWFTVYDSPKNRTYSIASTPHESIHESIDTWRYLTHLYQPTRITMAELGQRIDRDATAIFQRYANMNWLTRFAPLDRRDVARLMMTSQQIPAGITRIMLTGGRAIGVNVPLRLLKSHASDRQRDAWLKKLAGRVPHRYPGPSMIDEPPSARRYDEPLIVYDPAIRPLPIH